MLNRRSFLSAAGAAVTVINASAARRATMGAAWWLFIMDSFGFGLRFRQRGFDPAGHLLCQSIIAFGREMEVIWKLEYPRYSFLTMTFVT